MTRRGADELCFLDITASHEDRGILLDVVSRTAAACFMPLTVGGGVRTVDDIPGAAARRGRQGSIMTAAVHNRAFVREAAEKFGSQCVVVAVDAKRVSAEAPRPAGRCSLTAATCDGARCGRLCPRGRRPRRGRDPAHLHGPGRYQGRLRPRPHAGVADAVPVRVIASGGVGTLDHLVEGVREGRADAVLAASIFHFGTFTIGEAKRHMAESGLNMRYGSMSPTTIGNFTLDNLAALIARAGRSADRHLLHPHAAQRRRAPLRQEVRRGGGGGGDRRHGRPQAEIVNEAADVLYHLLVLLQASAVPSTTSSPNWGAGRGSPGCRKRRRGGGEGGRTRPSSIRERPHRTSARRRAG